eukprot:8884363-Ditylum_brightwellii.AAC.2
MMRGRFVLLRSREWPIYQKLYIVSCPPNIGLSKLKTTSPSQMECGVPSWQNETSDDERYEDELESERDLQDAWTLTTTKTMQQSDGSLSPLMTDIEENIYDFMDDHPLPLETIPEEENKGLAAVNKQAEFLRWQYHLGHLSFCKIQLLALVWILPRRLDNIRPPKCAGCIYGNMTRKLWRTKTKQNKNKIMMATTPGQVVSVDHLESTTSGFVV